MIRGLCTGGYTMPEILIVADDYTGANDTAVLI